MGLRDDMIERAAEESTNIWYTNSPQAGGLLMKMMSVAMVVLVCACGCQTSRQPASVSFCELISNPSAYNDTIITTTAILQAEPHYTFYLSDPDCPNKTIAVSVPEKIGHDPAIDLTRKIIFGNDRDPWGKVSSTSTGRFMWSVESRPQLFMVLTGIEVHGEVP